MTERLAGKVALVTGGGAGIGRGIARSFVREGAKLIIAELDAERAASDPLPRFLADPRAAALTEEKIAEIDAAILEEIDRGFEVTYAAAGPTPDKLYTDVYIHYEGRLQ